MPVKTKSKRSKKKKKAKKNKSLLACLFHLELPHPPRLHASLQGTCSSTGRRNTLGSKRGPQRLLEEPCLGSCVVKAEMRASKKNSKQKQKQKQSRQFSSVKEKRRARRKMKSLAGKLSFPFWDMVDTCVPVCAHCHVSTCHVPHALFLFSQLLLFFITCELHFPLQHLNDQTR